MVSYLRRYNRLGLAPGPSEGGNPREGVVAASKTAKAPGLEEIRDALIAARDGDFSRRLSRRRRGELGEIAAAHNEILAPDAAMEKELARMRRVIGREGRMDQRASLGSAGGGWNASVESL